jgi:hypothetical protein
MNQHLAQPGVGDTHGGTLLAASPANHPVPRLGRHLAALRGEPDGGTAQVGHELGGTTARSCLDRSSGAARLG